MVLHAVATGLAGLAFLFAIPQNIFCGPLASITAFFAWALCLIIMAIDFSWAGIIKRDVNDRIASTGRVAEWGAAIWLLTVAMILLFISIFIIFISCCSSRRSRRNAPSYVPEKSGQSFSRRFFGNRR
jgi:hypothetical protein